MDNIIFLDIDGVLNCEKAFKDGYCKYKEWDDSHHMSFYPPSKKLLNKLIEKTDAKIVISSSWRRSGLDWLKKVWKQENMKGEIIDRTPSFHFKSDVSIPRGLEIEYWLKQKGLRHINYSDDEQLKYMKESNIRNYIIIDDDSDMLYKQRNHFIHVLPSPRNKEGFNKEYYDQALNKLKKNIIDLKNL